MLLSAGEDIGLQPSLLAGFQVGAAAVAGIRNQSIRQLPSVGLDSLQHRQQMICVAELVADADRHDHLVDTVDRSLAVVTVVPAVSSFEDLAVGISVLIQINRGRCKHYREIFELRLTLSSPFNLRSTFNTFSL